MRAIWEDKTIAESDATVVVEGNHYFPLSSVKQEYLKKNGETYTCPWKGHADYYDVVVNNKVAAGAAWTYPDPSEAASNIKGYYAFWKGVVVTE
jgi:uncharacterized protein (DUF427 family)